VRNSWGEDWGVGGYAYLPYDYVANPDFNVCGMYAIEALTEVDLTPDEDDGEGLEEEEELDEEEEFDEEEDEWLDEDEEDEGYNDDDFFSPLAEARRVFNSFDIDGSGSMGKGELFLALRMNGVRVWPWQMDEMMASLDTDGSGTLDFNEFCAMSGIDIDAD